MTITEEQIDALQSSMKDWSNLRSEEGYHWSESILTLIAELRSLKSLCYIKDDQLRRLDETCKKMAVDSYSLNFKIIELQKERDVYRQALERARFINECQTIRCGSCLEAIAEMREALDAGKKAGEE